MSVIFDAVTGHITGDGVDETVRKVKDLVGVFRNETARATLDQEQVLYRVEAFEPVREGIPGGVGLATTYLMPGQVGDEYFLTRGHYHINEDRPELEVTISGEGYLVLMDRDRNTHMEAMKPGSVHPVGPGVAHRVANTGSEPLVFVSYWASETGHDYATIREHGFSARVRNIDGFSTLVKE